MLLLHDNARQHIGKVTQVKIMVLNMRVLPHPPYSLHFAPSDDLFFSDYCIIFRGKTVNYL